MSKVEVQAGPDLLQFRLLTGIRHGISTRHGGVSEVPYDSLNLGFSTPDDEANVIENRTRFARALGISSEDLTTAHLTHGSEVAVFDDATPASWPRAWHPVRAGSRRLAWVFEADAVVSNVSGLTFLLTAADCTPILFLDRVRGVVGAAHAGWRGTARGIAGKVIQQMTRAFGSDPGDVVTGIGPSMGPCCYTVGREVMDAFETFGTRPTIVADGDSVRLDLWESNCTQLVAAGVPPHSIEIMELCTGCHVSDFFSHRAEQGRTGRMAGAIGL